MKNHLLSEVEVRIVDVSFKIFCLSDFLKVICAYCIELGKIKSRENANKNHS